MKLLLTSAGLRNDVLVEALRGLLDRPFAESRIAVIPTAALATTGDHGWLIDDLVRLRAIGWRELNLLPLDGLPRERILERLRAADVIYAEGGSHHALASSILHAGLADDLRTLLDTKVWVGVSAGSMIFSRFFADGVEVFDERDELRELGIDAPASPVPLFDWYLKPHLGSPDFPERDAAWADRVVAAAGFPLQLIDDESALLVTGDSGERVEVVSASGAARLAG